MIVFIPVEVFHNIYDAPVATQQVGNATGGYLNIASDLHEHLASLARYVTSVVDVTIEEACEALGVQIYPVNEDGFELWDAISGDMLPEVRIPVREESKEKFYKYNQN